MRRSHAVAQAYLNVKVTKGSDRFNFCASIESERESTKHVHKQQGRGDFARNT